MKKGVTLLYYDWLAVKSWFKSQTLSKVLVLVAFAIIFFSLSFFLYFFSRSFFFSLSLYKEYGMLTSRYLIKAAVVITGWFALVASLVSSLGFLIKPNLKIEYLLTQPIKIKVISGWIFIKAVLANCLLLTIIFSPIMFAYADVFWGGLSINFMTRFYLVLGLFTILTTSLAFFLSYFLAYLIKKRTYLLSIIGVAVFFMVMFFLIYLIFPKDLTYLVEVQPEGFLKIYNKLPLSKSWLPSTWLTNMLLDGLSADALYLLILTIIVMIFAFYLQGQRFIYLFHYLNSQSHKKNLIKEWKNFFHCPLIYKDWLSVRRDPAETGYALFLLSIAIFFFFFLFRILIFKKAANFWRNEVIIFSFIWLLFFSSAFLLRLVFPLMAKEGDNAWYIFTLPVAKTKILLSKLSLGLIMSIPLFLFSLILWGFLPVEGLDRFLIRLVTLLAILWLSLVNVFLGSIFPNFKQGNDSEAVSTSGMGIITFMATVIISIFTAWCLFGVMKSTTANQKVIFLLLVSGLVTSFSLFSLAKYFFKNYEF
jgi:hypothetical protein